MAKATVRRVIVTLEIETDAAVKSLKQKSPWHACDPDGNCAVWRVRQVRASVVPGKR